MRNNPINNKPYYWAARKSAFRAAWWFRFNPEVAWCALKRAFAKNPIK